VNIVRNFNLIDIKRYEDETGNNILSYFNSIKFSNIVELIKLGNGNCSDEKAYEILDEYLSTNKNIVDAILEIKECLLGIGDNENNEVDDTEKIDITKYNSLTDLYIEFSMQLMSVGLAYNEFWSMNTKEMYKVFNSINIKMLNETNRELSNLHILAGMVGSAVWGKLSKEPPKVEPKQREEEEEDLELVLALKNMANKHNNKIKKEMKGE
jgi:hypothetical protein